MCNNLKRQLFVFKHKSLSMTKIIFFFKVMYLETLKEVKDFNTKEDLEKNVLVGRRIRFQRARDLYIIC